MLIEILRQTMLAGQVAKVGDVLEASPTDAKFLIGIAKAIQATAPIIEVAELIKPSIPKRRPKP